MKKKVIRLTWKEIVSYSKKIQNLLEKRKFTPDIIITPIRGGFVPTAILAHKLGIRNIYAVPSQKSVDDKIYTEWKKAEIKFFVPKSEIKSKNVLLLDDIFASGETMQAILEKVKNYSPKEVITASLFVNSNRAKEHNAVLPDIYIKQIMDWIVFPWEDN